MTVVPLLESGVEELSSGTSTWPLSSDVRALTLSSAVISGVVTRVRGIERNSGGNTGSGECRPRGGGLRRERSKKTKKTGTRGWSIYQENKRLANCPRHATSCPRDGCMSVLSQKKVGSKARSLIFFSLFWLPLRANWRNADTLNRNFSSFPTYRRILSQETVSALYRTP